MLGRFGGVHPLVAVLNLQPKPETSWGNSCWQSAPQPRSSTLHPAFRWVVLPELITTGYAGLPEIHHYAEYAKHATSAKFLASLVRRLGLYVA